MTYRTVLTMMVALAGVPAHAQEPAPTVPASGKPPAAVSSGQRGEALVPLKVTVVLSRVQGEKKIASLPYVLGVAANGSRTTMRMLRNVPVVQTVFGAPQTPNTSFSYRDVGTNIDCTATSAAGGLYRLELTVADTSIHLEKTDALGKTDAAATESSARGLPSFRTFNSSFSVVLRDGQTTQYTSATDPVSGEVVRIDVTLNVMK